MLETYLEWLTRRPLRVLIACLVVTAALAWGAALVEIYVDIDENLPSAHPYVRADRDIQEEFGGRNIVAIAVRPGGKGVWTARGLGLLLELTDGVMGLPDIIEGNVFSIAAPKVKDVRGTEEGFEVHRILETPPLDDVSALVIRDAYERNRSMLGPLVAPDGRTAGLFFDFADGVRDEEAYSRVKQLLERFERRYPDVEFFLTGRPIFAYFFTQYARGTLRYFVVALAVIMVTLYAVFRSIQGMLIPIGTGLLSTVWGLGVIGYSGAHIDGWNAMTPILILAVAAGHSVQILKRYYEEYARLAPVSELRERSRRAVVESSRRTGPVMIVAGAVAGGGFASLVVFGIPSIRSFGIFTAVGILSAVVLEMTFVPAARTLLPPPRIREHRGSSLSERFLLAAGRSFARAEVRAGVYLATLAILCASALFATRIEINNSFRDYLPRDSEARIGSEVLERDLGGIIPCFVLVEGAEENALQEPAVLTWMADLADELAKVPSVTVTLSLANVVRQLHRVMHNDDRAYDRVPDNRNLIAQYLLLYSMSAEPEDFSRLTTIDYSRGLLRATLRSDQSRHVLQAVTAIEAFARRRPLPAGVTMRIGGAGPVSLALDHTLIEGKIMNIGLVLLMVYVLSSVVLGSALSGAFIVLPLVVAVAANFGALGAFGLWLNMGTATIAAMAVGIGADYAIYLTYRLREEYERLGDEREAVAAALATSGKAVFFVALAISVGYSSLASSDFYLNHVLSRLVPLTMAVSCLVALTLLPVSYLHFRPQFLFSRGKRPAGGRARLFDSCVAHDLREAEKVGIPRGEDGDGNKFRSRRLAELLKSPSPKSPNTS